jgi:hypothetical protein
LFEIPAIGLLQLTSVIRQQSKHSHCHCPSWTSTQPPTESSVPWEEPSSSWPLLPVSPVFLFDDQAALPHQENVLSSVDLFLESLRDFGGCRRQPVTPCRVLHVRWKLAYSGMLSCIPRAPFATLFPECHAGLDMVACRTLRLHHP